MYYDIQQVCLNGHQITDYFKSHPETGKDFCEDCGAKTIIVCPKCSSPIRGCEHYEDSIGSSETPVPKHCHKCGEPYPWTKTSTLESSPSLSASGFVLGSDPVQLLSHLAVKFPDVVRQLLRRHNDRTTLEISDEYDVQDLLHALLRLYFDDVRPEEWTPSYAGSSTRMDFLLKNEQIVIEVKMTRKGLGAKLLGKELLDDIAHYQKHQDCKHLFCFVYDPGKLIDNPRGFESDLTETKDGLSTKVKIVH